MSNRAERRRQAKLHAKLGITGMDTSKVPIKISSVEKLVACALIDENGEVKHGFKSHAELRQYEPANPAHIYGFWTSKDRFVSRSEAVLVGVESGQLSRDWLNVQRELLSADVW